MRTGLVLTLLFLSTWAAKTQDVDQAEGAHRLHSYRKKFLNFLLQHFLSTDGNTIILFMACLMNNNYACNKYYQVVQLWHCACGHGNLWRGDHALQHAVLSVACWFTGQCVPYSSAIDMLKFNVWDCTCVVGRLLYDSYSMHCVLNFIASSPGSIAKTHAASRLITCKRNYWKAGKGQLRDEAKPSNNNYYNICACMQKMCIKRPWRMLIIRSCSTIMIFLLSVTLILTALVMVLTPHLVLTAVLSLQIFFRKGQYLLGWYAVVGK